MGLPDLGRFSDPSILILASLAGGKSMAMPLWKILLVFAWERRPCMELSRD